MDAKIPSLILGLVGGLCVIVGLWLTLARNGSDDAAVAGGGTAPTTNPASAAVAEAEAVSPSTTVPGSGLGTVTVTFGEGEAPPSAVPTLPPDAADFSVPCDPTPGGYGIEWKLWGEPESGVWLPYANGWPANQPGQPPVCAPETDFGAAVVAAHALYIDQLAPEWIPSIATDTPGRQARLERHGGSQDPAAINHVCEPVGWSRPDPFWVWIFHRCDNGPLWVTQTRMVWEQGRWQLAYLNNGAPGIHEPAEAGTAYAPFGEGAG
ncbi:MAG: hypothetical protein AAF962_18925 [Actinomycetota bacterium]